MDEYWIWLSTLKFVGPVSQKELLEKFSSPKEVYTAGKIDIEDCGINKRVVESILANKSLKEAEKIVRDIHKKNIGLVRFNDTYYPVRAKICAESPVLLYYIGAEPRKIIEAVAVVGSRRCSSYGKRVAQEIGRELALNEIPLISGFAKGIDSYAQAASVQNGGYTIGFLANGVDVCYPKEQLSLYEEVLQAGGTFISQYPPGATPKPEFFPLRNALISAWSKEIVVVEAEEKSGALWTAHFGGKYQRKVYAVPNQLGVREGVGTNNLIAQGAAKPFLGTSSLSFTKDKVEKKRLNELEITEVHKIVAYLQNSPKSIKEIAVHFATVEDVILEEILSLELEGILVLRGNMVFRV